MGNINFRADVIAAILNRVRNGGIDLPYLEQRLKGLSDGMLITYAKLIEIDTDALMNKKVA